MPPGILHRVGIKPPPGQQGPGGGVPAHDTWGAWSAAADARHQDGLALVDGERRGGAVYMFGYVAELHLKIAILKSLDHPENNYAFADIVIDNIKKIITSGASGKNPSDMEISRHTICLGCSTCW